MHAQEIIQEFLNRNCDFVHAKRRAALAAMAGAGSRGCLSMMGLSKSLGGHTDIRHRIKRCDRFLGNHKLAIDRPAIYGAMARRLLNGSKRPAIIVDWSDLRTDRSLQVLRAAVIVRGRAVTLYEEVHPIAVATSLKVHKAFLGQLKVILPADCRPVIVTDAGFRSTWFKLLDSIGYSWVGRIRNRDMIRPQVSYGKWCGCKVLYPLANACAKDLGAFEYVRQHPVSCRLVVVKRRGAGRHRQTVHGERTRSSHSLKQANANKEPWLLATSPDLSDLPANAVVAIYAGRMQIEQTFRDTKNGRWGLGLTHSQTRRRDRMESLLLIGALTCYALWIIGITARYSGYRVEYGSKQKARNTISILSLAKWWIDEFPDFQIPATLIVDAIDVLASMVKQALK